MERQAESLAPYWLSIPQGASVFRLPPQRRSYSDAVGSSYKGAYTIRDGVKATQDDAERQFRILEGGR